MLIVLVVFGAAACESGETEPTVSDPPGTGGPDTVEGAQPPSPPERDEAAEPTEPPGPPHGGAYGISAAHPDAVDAGMEILDEGGTAMDAAIATAFAVSVVEPFASGLGGGGSAVIYELEGEAVAYDYRCPVPESGEVPSGGTGVPGFVAGMEHLHEAHGSGPFARLVEPAIRLAEEGAETSEALAFWLNSGGIPAGELPHLYPDGAPLAEDDLFVQEELAETLGRVAEGGAEEFYRGSLAEEVAERVSAIDAESLAAYEVAVHEPTVGAFAGYDVVSSAPPLAGAPFIQYLQVAEALGIADYEPASADHIHALAMAWRISESNLNSQIADPAFVDVPVDELTDADRNAAVAGELEMGTMPGIEPGQPYGGLDAPEGNTTHITVVDTDGTMVSMTNTIANFWGSGDYESGFFLNDELRNFSARPGTPNPPPEAGKRIVGSSAPAIVVDEDGRPVLGLGSPGGLRIPSILSQVLIRWALHGEDLAEAVEAPRQHGEGRTLTFEDMPGQEVLNDLSDRGHPGFEVPSFRYYLGSVQALEVDYEAEEVRGATDPRRDGDWRAGVP